MKHKERAHSKYSASGSERWHNCPGSVALEDGQPDTSNAAADAGTQCHEIHEALTVCDLTNNDKWALKSANELTAKAPLEMVNHAHAATDFVVEVARKKKAELLVETRVYLKFIHPEMFGTFDDAILDFGRTLDVFDLKYGTHPVSPTKNLQFLFYGIGLAHLYDWDFKSVRLWAIQPRARGYDGPVFWEESIKNLKNVWVPEFERAVERVEKFPKKYKEGNWCFFCKGRKICPLKADAKIEKAQAIFGAIPQKGKTDGKEKTAAKSETKGREKSNEEKRRLSKKGWQKAEDEESFI